MHKLTETYEEKKARRKAKKAQKEQRRQVHTTAIAAHGYSDSVNPFGDEKLSEAFKWGAKDAEGGGKTTRRDEEESRRVMDEEIRKVKRRREEREEELAMWEDEKQRLLADQDGLTLEEWEERGNEFELDQLVMRADNRLAEHRLKPIDVLLFTFRILSGKEDISKLQGDLRDPAKVISGLSIADLKELTKEVDSILQYDVQFKQHWAAVKHLVASELAEQLRGDTGSGMHGNVKADVAKKFSTKTLAELEADERMILQNVKSGGASMDVEFWDSLLKQLSIWKSKAFLRCYYEDNIDALLGSSGKRDKKGVKKQGDQEKAKVKLCTEESDSDDDLRTSGVSPKLTPLNELSDVAVDALAGEVDDLRELMGRRRRKLAEDGNAEQENLMRRSGVKLGEEEELFDDQIALKKSYSWHDTYRPRKPKYFNRVHTGFDWNKYNSTHYDVDNPPPKQVLGYKFNIFYPDLVNPTQQPAYFVEPTAKGWRDDTCLLRFSAGPPYEDICFSIVNKEWDKNWRAGYKCTFDRGVLVLHFSFIRYRYRR